LSGASTATTTFTWPKTMPNISVAAIVLRGFHVINANQYLTYESKLIDFS